VASQARLLMKYYNLEIAGLKRKLPIVTLGPKVKVASFNLLGDRELVGVLAQKIVEKLKEIEFDYLIGPEAKVVPLLHELCRLLGKKRYVVCRKKVHGYMVSPLKSKRKPTLVLDGADLVFLEGKKVVVVDDVVSSGRTMQAIDELMEQAGVQVVARLAVFRQGKKAAQEVDDLIFLDELPLFGS